MGCDAADVAATFNVASTVVSTSSIKFSWTAGSPLTASFLVYGERVINSRDLSVGNWTLLANSTSTSLTVTGLASGAFYIFSVHSITAEGVDSNQQEYTFQTTSVSNQATIPEGGTCKWFARGLPPPAKPHVTAALTASFCERHGNG